MSISDIHDLVAHVDIVDFVVHEERARRVEWPGGEEPAEPRSTIRLAIRREVNRIGYRFRLTLADAAAEYVSDIEAIYEVEGEDEEPPSVDIDVIKEFAERVAFMTVYPYLRTSIFGAAGRIGRAAPVMGIVRQGQFQAGVEMEIDEVEREFHDTTSELGLDRAAD